MTLPTHTALTYANSQFRFHYTVGRTCRFGHLHCAIRATRKWASAYRYGKSVGL